MNSFAEEINFNWANYSNKKATQGDNVYRSIGNVFPSNFIEVIFYKGIGQIGLAQFFFYLPLPVGDWAVADAVPNAQN